MHCFDLLNYRNLSTASNSSSPQVLKENERQLKLHNYDCCKSGGGRNVMDLLWCRTRGDTMCLQVEGDGQVDNITVGPRLS